MKCKLLQKIIQFVPVVVALVVVGCGGGGGGEGGGASPTAPTLRALAVTFEYQASTTIDPAVDFSTCTVKQVRFTSHLHFTWNEWDDRRYMKKINKNLFSYVGEVPVGQEVQIALHDPNSCLRGDPYVAPQGLYANGTLLNRIVDVDEGRGLAFRLQGDGTIVP